MRDPDLYDNLDPDIIERSQYQPLNPDGKPLAKHIETTYWDALFEEVDNVPQDYGEIQNHTKYWFTVPEGALLWQLTLQHLICSLYLLLARQNSSDMRLETGGWNQTPKLLRKATVVPNQDAKAANFGDGRVGTKVVHTPFSGCTCNVPLHLTGLLSASNAFWMHI